VTITIEGREHFSLFPLLSVFACVKFVNNGEESASSWKEPSAAVLQIPAGLAGPGLPGEFQPRL
jgi:hypothetical protein